jgi:hypothetical protein
VDGAPVLYSRAVDWLCLGHATWLCEAAGLRVLFDPLLGPHHHGGVFEVVPRRTLVAEALRPDFIMVSHRHPDHFDVPSLRRLIALDPEAVVVTPDALVAWAAERLGARTVRIVGAGQRLELDGVTIVTTPSIAPDEWGAVVATKDGAAWNQVDTVLRGPDEVQRVARRCAAEVGADRLALALVRWQPLLEVAAQLGHRTAFPYEDYAALLASAAATEARVVVPSAAGEAHVRMFGAMNARVFPVGERRFLRDLAGVAPEIRGLPCRLGAGYRVRGGEVEWVEGVAENLLVRGDGEDPRRYAPLEFPPVFDPGLEDVPEAVQRAEVEAWVRGPLAAGLARVCVHWGFLLKFVVELRFASAVDVYTLRVDDGVVVARGFDEDWDGLNIAAGSLVWAVLQGRRNWGDVLLAGALRGCTRAYSVDEGRLRRLPIGELFVYHGLSYADSVERSVRREVLSG